jgi:two-component system OmpR family sensor kinase
MYAAFRSRVTAAYVLLAVVLIFAIVGTSSFLAILLFSRGTSDAVNAAAQRASDVAARDLASGQTLVKAAPHIVSLVGRAHFRVRVIDDRGRVLAQNQLRDDREPDGGFARAFAGLVGTPRARVPVSGGAVLIGADADRFGGVLLWYWEIMLPVGVVAVIVAWLLGRRITLRAVGPLAEVTGALRTIAAGDFSPQPVRQRSSDLHELTDAYNDVAYRLAAATADQQRTEAQMRQFIADAGHELRTPLTIIMGYLDALRRGIVHERDATQRTYETMLDESRKMRALIEKLIMLARLDRAPAPAIMPVDLNEIARRVKDSLDPLAPGRIEVQTPLEPAVVNGDENELHEAVKNIVDNALKYAPQSPVTIAVSSENGQGCIEVSDRGPGMEPQDVRHAFDRFYRGTSRGEVEGSGLGLAIAKRAAERSGGQATLDSAVGAGTRVRLCLPSRDKVPAER